ncbi:MAG TPA: protein kinase [Acidimicrobiia bacterium]|nr:protein kinase [Acidimicrobiia bacterium]
MELTAPGTVLGGRYRLVSPIARGGMATVWVADDPVLSRRVAVKILRSDLAADEGTRVRFRHEAIAAARLSHPNIVSTYDTGDDEGIAYIVMELVDGPTLRHLIDEHNGLHVADVIRIGKQVADALDAAHRAGIVHRDVKPANVLVPRAGPVKVTDFGIAKAAGGDDLTRTGTVMGTARYLAPEQVNGRPTDPRTDVYALGLLMFESLVGHPPFGGDTDIATAMARLTTSAPAIRVERPEVSQALDDVIHRCLARQPEARFGSAAAVRDALDRARLDPTGSLPSPVAPAPVGPARPAPRPAPPPAHTGPTSPQPVPLPPPAAPPRRRRRLGWLWALLVVLVAIGGGVLAYVLVSDGGSSTGANGGAGPAPPAASKVVLTPTAFDPLGDGTENPDLVNNAVDGNPTTSWTTEQYDNFPDGAKNGVGLAFALSEGVDVNKVFVETQQHGWGASIYVSDKSPSELKTLGDWGEARAHGSDLDPTHTFDLGGIKANSVLLWLTQLPAGQNGKHYVDVSEVRVA